MSKFDGPIIAENQGMLTSRIGSLEVSMIGRGCNNFGRRLHFKGPTKVVDAALEEGINFFNTADIYGSTMSQEYLSKTLGKTLGKRRQDVIVATKARTWHLTISISRRSTRSLR